MPVAIPTCGFGEPFICICHVYYAYSVNCIALKRCSPGAEGLDLDSTDKVFLQILVAQVVPIENRVDDIASPLGISSNMLIKRPLPEVLFCPKLAKVNMHARAMKMVTIPTFSRWRNHMTPFLGS